MRWLRTVAHLRPSQPLHRVRLRAQRAAIGAAPAAAARLLRTASAAAEWPADFVAVDERAGEGFPSAEANAKGEFRFLAVSRHIGDPPDWEQLGASRLWRFHLHYFDWAWSFVAAADAGWAQLSFERLWRSWRESAPFGRGDAWAPYVASVRAWNLCGASRRLVEGTAAADEYAGDLALHAGYIRAHVERDLGGNHVVKNLKALVGLGVFTGNRRLAKNGLERLAAEVEVQVLGDGGHYERSTSYHVQVLGDLIDAAGLARSAGLGVPAPIDAGVASMRRWLRAMILPDGTLPLVNDAVPVEPARLDAVGAGGIDERRCVVLEQSGYVVTRPARDVMLVADVGEIGPPSLPAHAHADTLSFVLWVGGRPVVVDTGTSTYEAGELRDYERSTRAHNTVEVDGQDQSEVYGAFRAARRAHGRLERAVDHGDEIEIVARHDGYCRLDDPVTHRRTWLAATDRVLIRDDLSGRGRHEVAFRLQLPPGDRATVTEAGFETPALRVAAPWASTFEVGTGWCAAGFGNRAPAEMLVARRVVDVPIVLETSLELRRS